MKKVLILLGVLFTFFISSCNGEDDLALRFEPLSVVDVSFPDQLQVLETHKIVVTYLRPSNCHYFEGFDYERTGNNETTVFLIASVFDDQPCQEINTTLEASFDFNPEEEGAYRFKFWEGKDSNGQDIYYIVDVNVE